jgi:hypothetical protein
MKSGFSDSWMLWSSSTFKQKIVSLGPRSR